MNPTTTANPSGSMTAKTLVGIAMVMFLILIHGPIHGQQPSLPGLYQYSSLTQTWVPLTLDQDIPPGTRLFNPTPREVQLILGGDRVSIGPFTEISVRSVRTNFTPTVVQVPSGTIRAQVRTASSQERGVRFQVQSPVATASVRGTEFQFGWTRLAVAEGDVVIQNLLGQSHSVRADQQSEALAQQPIQSVEVSLRRNTRID